MISAPAVALTGARQVVPIPGPITSGYGREIRIDNESPYALSVQFSGEAQQHWIDAWTADAFAIRASCQQLTLVPTQLQTPPPLNISATLLLTVTEGPDEHIPGVFPVALVRQVASGSGTGTPALIQHAKAAGAGLGSITATFATPSRAGTLLVACYVGEGAWQTVGGLVQLPPGWVVAQSALNVNADAYICYYPSNPGGITSVPFVVSSTFPDHGQVTAELAISEWDVMAPAPLDVVTVNQPGAAATTWTTGASPQTNQASELVIGFFCSASKTVDTPFAAAAGYTLLDSGSYSAVAYQVVSSLAAQTATITAGSDTYSAALATFKAAGGAGIGSNVSSVASSAVSVQLLATNAARKGFVVYNDSTQVLYLLLGAGSASSSVYTAQLNPNDYWESPLAYTGAVAGIWAAANGNARITEFA